MNVLVFADSFNGSIAKSAFEATAYGAKIAANNGGQAAVVTYGKVSDQDLNEMAAYGISQILKCTSVDHLDPQQLARLAQAAANEIGADLIVFSHDYSGKSIAPIAAAKMKAGLVSGAIDYPDTSNGFSVKKAVFSGKAFGLITGLLNNNLASTTA